MLYKENKVNVYAVCVRNSVATRLYVSFLKTKRRKSAFYQLKLQISISLNPPCVCFFFNCIQSHEVLCTENVHKGMKKVDFND